MTKNELVKEVMMNMPEYAMVLECTKWKYDDCIYEFYDSEEDEQFSLNEDKLVKGFDLMFKDFNDKKLEGIRQSMGDDIFDPGNWDATCVMALVEYAIYGKLMFC